MISFLSTFIFIECAGMFSTTRFVPTEKAMSMMGAKLVF